jgi:hypothetical protein
VPIRVFVSQDIEAWRPVVGFPGYEISSRGAVRGLRRPGGALMRPRRNPAGYLSVSLVSGGKQHKRFVHRLVAEAFLGPLGPGMTVHHKDHSRDNNASSNLEHLSHIENVQKSLGRPRKIKVHLTDEQIRIAEERNANGASLEQLAAEYDVAFSTIRERLIALRHERALTIRDHT